MNIVADESVDKQVVDELRARGHAVAFIAELEPGIEDEIVLARSQELGAVLLTANKDFGEPVFRQGLIHSGIMLVRLEGLAPAKKADLVASTVDLHAEGLKLGFAVLSKRGLRIRRTI